MVEVGAVDRQALLDHLGRVEPVEVPFPGRTTWILRRALEAGDVTAYLNKEAVQLMLRRVVEQFRDVLRVAFAVVGQKSNPLGSLTDMPIM